MSLGQKLGRSIFNMGIQRLLDLVSVLLVTAIVVRSLDREEYGMLSLVLSYGLIFNFFNVSLANVLLRDYQKAKPRIGEYVHSFVLFSAVKAALVAALSVGIGLIVYARVRQPEVLVVVGFHALGTALLYATEPLTTLLSVDFRQASITRVNAVSAVVNVVLSAFAILFPSAVFVSAKNAAVALVGLVLTARYVRKAFQIGPSPALSHRVRLIRESLFGFSLWTHMMGIVTDIIYRADLLILGWIGSPLRVVGNYNVALQMANFTKLAPQILQYNATLGLTHSPDAVRRDEVTFLFVKYSFVVSLATIVGYWLFGRWAIFLVAGTGVDEIYRLGFYIIGGLCIYNAFRPIVSYASVAHSVRECFLLAVLPSGICTVAAYVFFGLRWGAEGLAMANVVGGLVMTAFTLLYAHTRTEFRWRVSLITPSERALFARVRARIALPRP